MAVIASSTDPGVLDVFSNSVEKNIAFACLKLRVLKMKPHRFQLLLADPGVLSNGCGPVEKLVDD
jgi:hypothetical protein